MFFKKINFDVLLSNFFLKFFSNFQENSKNIIKMKVKFEDKYQTLQLTHQHLVIIEY